MLNHAKKMTKEHPRFSKVCKLVGRGLIDEFVAYGGERVCVKKPCAFIFHIVSLPTLAHLLERLKSETDRFLDEVAVF